MPRYRASSPVHHYFPFAFSLPELAAGGPTLSIAHRPREQSRSQVGGRVIFGPSRATRKFRGAGNSWYRVRVSSSSSATLAGLLPLGLRLVFSPASRFNQGIYKDATGKTLFQALTSEFSFIPMRQMTTVSSEICHWCHRSRRN